MNEKKNWNEKKANRRAMGEHLFDHSLAHICCQDLCYFLWSNVLLFLPSALPKNVTSILSFSQFPCPYSYQLLFDLNNQTKTNNLPCGPLLCGLCMIKIMGQFLVLKMKILKSTRQVLVAQALGAFRLLRPTEQVPISSLSIINLLYGIWIFAIFRWLLWNQTHS